MADGPKSNEAMGEDTDRRSRFVAELGRRLDVGVQEGRFSNLHAVVLTDGEELLFERYFDGIDERWGTSLGTVSFAHDTLHDLRSVTKSVVGLLYGIALDEGKVPSLDQSLVRSSPQFAELVSDPARARITVADVLTDRGLEWDESRPYSDPRNSEIAMEYAPDRCRYVLERPIVNDPGTRWNYSGGATALLACLLTEGTGMSLLEYARLKLFRPLAIDPVDWVTGSSGSEVAASGLRLRPRDLAKIGQLLLNRGRHKDMQVVPESWIEASLQPHTVVDEDFAYGYQWWIARHWAWVAAFGNGGQRVTVLPKAGLVLVVLAGNYNSPTAWQVPAGVLVDVVVPALSQ
jgi:CubicO group peptidase (beta-lactamase class C family)